MTDINTHSLYNSLSVLFLFQKMKNAKEES